MSRYDQHSAPPSPSPSNVSPQPKMNSPLGSHQVKRPLETEVASSERPESSPLLGLGLHDQPSQVQSGDASPQNPGSVTPLKSSPPSGSYESYSSSATHVIQVESDRGGKRSPISGWFLEILTTVMSLTCFVAIVVICWRMNDEPVSSWESRVKISLNTAIAALTTACTTLMMHNVGSFLGQLKWSYFKVQPRPVIDICKFDDATRGPLGAFLFLFRKRLLGLATLGACITILQLTFSSFTQEAVRTYSRSIPRPDERATFGFAHEYNRQLRTANDAIGAPPDPSMQSAIIRGLFQIDTQPLFNCSGNCSWPDSYVSLGFKTECRNVTLATLKTEECVKPQGIEYCNMTTPAGLQLGTLHGETDSQTTFNLSASLIKVSAGDPLALPRLLDFAVYRSTMAGTGFNAGDVNITDCTLSFAAYRYSNAKAIGNEFSVDIESVDISRKNWTLVNDLVMLNESKTDGLPKFTVFQDDIDAMQDYLTSGPFVSEWAEGNVGWLGNNKYRGISAGLAGDVNLTEAFDSMAMSMTDYFRAGPNMQLARGNRVERREYVSFRWEWLIVPGVLEVAAVVFGVLSLIRNYTTRGTPLWKSSAAALLACQHVYESGGSDGTLEGDIRDSKEIEERAEEEKAQLK